MLVPSTITNYFDKFDSDEPLPRLPLIHTTSAFSFAKKIACTKKLTPSRCEFFEQELLYFFYGRPAYRVASKIGARADLSYYPVCLILRPDFTGEGELKAVYPFDTGAFYKQAFKGFIHEDMNVNSFYLGDSLNIPPKVIAAFFGDNRKYYLGKVRPGLEFKFSDMEATAYYQIITATGESLYDDRRYTIEVQFGGEIDIDNNYDIVAVVLPRGAADDEQILSVITKWDATPLFYDSFNFGKPSDTTSHIVRLVQAFYEEKEWM